MITVRGIDAVEVLKSDAFEVACFANSYRLLEQRLGLDFSSVIRILETMPLALNGAEHAARRGDMIRIIAEARPRLFAALPQIVAEHFDALSKPGRHDLVADAIVPAVHQAMGVVVGTDTGLAVDTMVSQVLDVGLGVAQRVRMNADLAGLISCLRTSSQMEDEDRLNSRLALVVLGREPMIGTIGLALLEHLQTQAPSLRVAPAHSGVPFIARRAVTDVVVAGEQVCAQEFVRCELQSGDAVLDKATFFGSGPHMCVGRVLANDMFQALTRYLDANPLTGRWIEATTRQGAVFRGIDRMIYEVTPR